jgi:hypothetical protein
MRAFSGVFSDNGLDVHNERSAQRTQKTTWASRPFAAFAVLVGDRG